MRLGLIGRRTVVVLMILVLSVVSIPSHSMMQAFTLLRKTESVSLLDSDSNTSLFITEIMYNPVTDDAFPDANPEFLELHNPGDGPFDLSGAQFSAGIEYTFAAGVLLPADGYLVLTSSSVDFRNKYGFTPFGQYGGLLNNAGERITLDTADGTTLFTVRYNEKPPWPSSPDGSGFSLVLRDPSNQTADLDIGANWRASSAEGGSPGKADEPSGLDTPGILVNEVLPHTDLPLIDSVEIYNPTDKAVTLAGWFITDDHTQPRQFRIPDGPDLPPGGFRVFDEQELGFGFSSFGEEAYIFAADELGNLTGYSHGFSFGTSANGVSFGRYVTSTGKEQYPAQSKQSLGAANAGPKVGPVVISEIMYHPLDNGDEYAKLTNISDQPVQLYDAAYPDNTWRFSGIGNYVLPKGMILAPGGDLLIVPTEPDQFRAKHMIPAEVQVTGPYTGTLDNDGEMIQLLQPDSQDSDGTVPYFVVDAVRYNDAPPWPVEADGLGPPLRRIDLAGYGNDPVNWHASSTRRVFLPVIASDTH